MSMPIYLPSFRNKMKRMKKIFPNENFICGWCVGYGCEFQFTWTSFTMRSHFSYNIWCFLNMLDYQMMIYVYLLNIFSSFFGLWEQICICLALLKHCLWQEIVVSLDSTIIFTSMYSLFLILLKHLKSLEAFRDFLPHIFKI